MKTLLVPLALVCVLAVASTASAAVIVNAGPVHVAVGVRPHYHPIHPVHAIRPMPLPVMAAPAFVPPPPVAGSPGVITPREWREIREEARELRQEIRQAGPVVTPQERREIREESRELWQEIRQAVRR
jgi:hypothetical protein